MCPVLYWLRSAGGSEKHITKHTRYMLAMSPVFGAKLYTTRLLFTLPGDTFWRSGAHVKNELPFGFWLGWALGRLTRHRTFCTVFVACFEGTTW